MSHGQQFLAFYVLLLISSIEQIIAIWGTQTHLKHNPSGFRCVNGWHLIDGTFVCQSQCIKECLLINLNKDLLSLHFCCFTGHINTNTFCWTTWCLLFDSMRIAHRTEFIIFHADIYKCHKINYLIKRWQKTRNNDHRWRWWWWWRWPRQR